MTTRRLLAVLAPALLVAGAVTTPAAAETEVHADPRGDVQRYDARGGRTSADVLRLRGEHQGAALRVSVDLVDLTPRAPAYVEVRVLTPRGTDYTVGVLRDDDGRKDVFMTGETDRASLIIVCDDLTGRFFNRTDRVAVTIPRSCLRRPRWVRFGALAAAASPVADREYSDDARRDGYRDPDRGPALGSRRLHRG